MSYNFLGLTNDAFKRLNEAELTSSNFDSASGFAADVKSYVNSSLNRINIEQFEWPFNHAKQTLVLTPDQSTYSYPNDAKTVAFDTFRLKGDTALNCTSQKLRILDYEEYLNSFSDYEFNPTNHHDVPRMVVRNRNRSFTVAPPPNLAYEIHYEYYRFPEDLQNWDDVPTVPAQFRWIILEGALYHAYMFRGGLEEAAVCNQRFEMGLKAMRTLYINRPEYARSTVINS